MKIRPAVANDARQIAAIESTQFSNPITTLKARKVITDNSDTPFYAAVAVDDDDKVVGHCFLAEASQKGTTAIYCVAVKKSEQKNGIGTALIEDAVGRLKEQKSIALEARVQAERFPAQMLLSKMGFYCNGTEMHEVDSKADENSETPSVPMEVLRFRYTVPFDDLSTKHIASLAKGAKSRKSPIED